MDLVPALGVENSLKEPVIQVEAVDMASAEVDKTAKTVTLEKEEQELQKKEGADEERLQSEYETNSEAGSEDWETQSLYEDALQFIRDEQLRDGGKDSLHIQY